MRIFTRICIYFTNTTVTHLTEFGNFTGDKKKKQRKFQDLDPGSDLCQTFFGTVVV